MIFARTISIVFASALVLGGCAGKKSDESTLADKGPITLAPQEFKARLSSTPDAVLVDVRKPEEVAEGMIEGAINIDYTDSGFVEKIGALDKTKPYFVYCKVGKRSAGAADEMEKLGFEKVYVLEGGYTEWLQNDLK